MNEQDVASIAEQFNLDKEIVESSISDGTLGQRIKDSLASKVVYDKNDFETFKTNYSKEVKDSYFSELVELAKKGEVPHDLHSPIKGAATEQLERQLSKKFEVKEYSDVHDLIDRIVKSSANGKTDDQIMTQLEELKQANLTLQSEKENAISEVEKKYRDISLNKDKSQVLNSIPFDFSDYKQTEVDTAKAKVQKVLQSVFDADYTLDYDEANNLIVKERQTGNVLKSEATREPIPASNVLINLAKEINLKLKSPDTGGQGGKSSGQTESAFESVQQFDEAMRSKGINPNDPRYIEEYRKSGLSKNLK